MDTADDSDNFDGLRVCDCTRCPALVESRSQIVNGVGPSDASLLFVGEGPGATEDEQGEPFVGRSGDILSEALSAACVSREAIRITNCVRCRPPENRDPKADELENCHGYLEREIETVDPDLLVTLGKVPSQHLLDRSVAITKEAGSIVETRLGGAPRRILLSMHPAATLYDRSQREPFFETIAEAAAIAGLADDDSGDGQSRLGEF